MTRPPTVIPADEYDCLEFVAEAYDGVGAGKTYESFPPGAGFPDPTSAPFCLLGCAHFAGILDGHVGDLLNVDFFGLRHFEIDQAIWNVQGRIGSFAPRVPFADLAAELNLVRGD